MEAKELRIGNLVYDTLGKVNKINLEALNDILKEPKNQIKPIPLTEEWLLSFGFESYNLEYTWKNKNLIIEKSENGYVKLADDYFIDSFEFKHVHQLQNLYFALSNEELILNQ